MSNILQLLDRGKPTLRGWQESDRITAGEAEKMQDPAGDNPRRTATAIPTPFGRMHLLETAFKFVRQQPQGNSLYHRLVSQCWDLLELMFYHKGTDAYRLRFVPWAKQEQVDQLLRSPEPRIRLLGNTLRLYLNDAHFRDLDSLYLIFADSHDASGRETRQLLGGTSPFTLVFAHPAVPRLNMQRKGDGNGFYFDPQVVPLAQRSAEFQTYLFGLFEVQPALRQENFAQCMAQFLAVADKGRVQQLAEQKPSTTVFEQPYEKLRDTLGNAVQVRGVDLWRLAEGQQKATSDWFIDFNPAVPQVAKVPLVLMPGLDLRRSDYFGGTAGTDQTVVQWGYEGQTLEQRRLETLGVQYPFLTVNDFLEDQLLEMPFAVNTERYHFGTIVPEPGARAEDRPFRFLLPLKRAWFDYFEPADIDRRLVMTVFDNHVQVQLKVPVRSGREVVYERSYYFRPGPSQAADASVAAVRSDSPKTPYRGGRVSARLDVGVFPFYKFSGEDARDNGPYYVQLADQNEGSGLARLAFYQGGQPLPALAEGGRRGVRVRQRMGRNPRGPASTYYEVVGTHFDFMEVAAPASDQASSAVVTGLLVPRWEPTIKGAKRYTFAVDFGTTNTHVAYATTAQPTPQPFSIGTEREMQSVMLNRPRPAADFVLPRRYDSASFGMMPLADTLRNREFVPAFIGVEGAESAFPIRTATCESPAFTNEGNWLLFGSINIGFHMSRDGFLYNNPEDGRYHTNLKWETEGSDRANGIRRIQAYVRELLLLIKHKVALNEGNVRETQVVWSRPLSMKNAAQQDLRDIWESEYQTVFGQAPGSQLADLSESWAPYLYLTNPNTEGGIVPTDKENVVNIDIGGGTTDVLLLRGTQPEATLSFRFAGDMLWGDGALGGSRQQNALVLYYGVRTAKETPSEEARAAREVVTAALKSQVGSADIASLLFNFDKQLGFSRELRSARHLRIMMLLHYAAIVYHVGQVCRVRQLAVPRHLCFSGKGSTYLRILDLDPQLGTLAEIGRLILEFAADQPAPADFRLTLVNQPKEATANGAVLWKQEKADATQKKAPGKYVLAGTLPTDAPAGPAQGPTLAEAEHLDEAVLANARRLVRFITHDSAAVRGLLDELNVEIEPDFVYDFLDSKLKDSLYAGLNMLRKDGAKADDHLPETLFFLPFRDALFQLGRELFKRHYASQSK